MRLTINNSYFRDIRGIQHSGQIHAANVLQTVLNAAVVSDIPHLKSLTGYPGYYRIRIGQYRIGLRWDGEQFFAERIGLRGDFYKGYPPK